MTLHQRAIGDVTIIDIAGRLTSKTARMNSAICRASTSCR